MRSLHLAQWLGVGVKGPVVRFSSSTMHTIQISTREEGLSTRFCCLRESI
jgi:hypothetical protein